MLKSIHATYERAGRGARDIRSGSGRWGLNLFEKAKRLNELALYESLYRMGTHAIHGTWHELEFHHLDLRDGDEYAPELRFTPPTPELLEAPGGWIADGTAEYVRRITATDGGQLATELMRVRDWFVRMAMRRGAVDFGLETQED